MSTRRRRAGDASKAVGYLRVSTSEQASGLETQRLHLDAYAATHGLEIVSVHVDEGVSGATPIDRRPGLLAALGDLQSHGAGVLLAPRRDRLGRDPLILIALESECSRIGARIVTIDGVSDGDDAGAELLRHMVDGVSRFERRLIASRVREGMAKLKVHGKTTGTPPYGYSLAADGETLEPLPEEQETITRILGLHQEGVSQRRIVEWLEASGVPARGTKWHKTTIARILAGHGGGPSCPS